MRIPTEEQWCRVEALSEELAGLAPDEVERRLQSLARQGESPTVLAHLRPWLALPPDSPDPGPGSVVGGGYTLVEKLGRGGMGVVWRATQQSVGRDVALKIIHPVLVSPALRKRAVDEIRLLGRLNHPGIVRIFDAGFHEDPRHGRIPFFAMEWVEGVSLDRWAQAHRDDARSKLRLMVAVCEAVQAAHDRRIVHRDLKPANILVREDGSPVVLDFGIARLVGMGEEGEANVFSGTPEYAAPEQHLGKDQDFRSGESVDVYALGVILFELMAGRRFLPVPSGASPSEIRRAVLEGHLPRLSDTMAGCPPELDEVVRRAVRRDPADRFYSVSALGLAVARVAASMGGTAEPVRRWESEAGALVPGTRWRLQEKLGEGGTGEVWAGRHEELGTRCVFKFCSTEETARTLKREFTLFRLLKERVGRNPHFVQLLEVSLDEPPWYLMMDYEEARDLESWCTNRPGGLAALPLEARIEIVAQAAEALQAAHEAGILHRDIKPANLLVRGGTAGTSDLHVLVADFGIGQLVLDLVVPNDARLGFTRTVSGLQRSKISGTMLYLAPEVLEGEAATARSDVYSLGVVLWQLLVGNLNAALDVTDWPARISDPLLREDLQRCLAGLPGKRWASAGELAASLRALPARTADAARRRAELAARERAAYRRGVVRSACITVGILGMVAVIGWYAFDRDRAARVNAFSTQVAELANLALGSFPNRAATAATLVRGTPPRTEDERRALADAYVRVLELDDWVVDSAPASEAFRSDIVAAAAEPTFRYVLRYARPSGLEAMDLDTGRVERLPADDLFSGRTPGPTQAGEDSGVGIDSEVPTSAPEPGEGVVLALARRAVRAAVASGNTLRIFGDAPLKAEATLRTEHPVASLAWNSRGDLLAVGMASANGEGMVELRAAPSWSTVRRLTKTDENPYSRRPTGLAFSPDDARLAQWSLDSLHLLFWDVAKGELVAYAYHPAPVSVSLWASNGRVYSGSDDGFLYRWDFGEDMPRAGAIDRPTARFPALGARLSGHHRRWQHIVPTTGGGFLAAADDGGAVFCFDLSSGQVSLTVSENAGVVSLGSAGGSIVTCRGDGRTGRIRRSRSKISRSVSSQRLGRIRDFDVSSDGSLVACAGTGGVVVFDGEDAERQAPGKTVQSYGVRWLGDDRWVASSRFGDFTLVWNGETLGADAPPPTPVFLEENRDNTPARIAIDASGNIAATARARSVRAGSMTRDHMVRVECDDEAPPEDLAIAPGGTRFAWTDRAGDVWVAAVQDGTKSRLAVKGTQVRFLRDDVVSVSSAAGVRVVDLRGSVAMGIENLDLSKVTGLAMQDAGSLAAAASDEDGLVLGRLERGPGWIWHGLVRLGADRKGGLYTALRFTGGGRWLGAIREDGEVQVWDVESVLRALEEVGCLREGFSAGPATSGPARAETRGEVR